MWTSPFSSSLLNGPKAKSIQYYIHLRVWVCVWMQLHLDLQGWEAHPPAGAESPPPQHDKTCPFFSLIVSSVPASRHIRINIKKKKMIFPLTQKKKGQKQKKKGICVRASTAWISPPLVPNYFVSLLHNSWKCKSTEVFMGKLKKKNKHTHIDQVIYILPTWVSRSVSGQGIALL